MKKIFLMFLFFGLPVLAQQVNLGPTNIQVKGVLQPSNGGTGTSSGAWQPPLFGSGAPSATCTALVNNNLVYFNTATSPYSEYVCAGASGWKQIGSGGSGTVTTTGTPSTGNIAVFSGASSITSGNLSGDVSTSGLVTTVSRVNGTSIPASSTLVGTNSSRQFINQTGTISNNTTGTAVALAGPQTHVLGFADVSNTVYSNNQVITTFLSPIAQSLASTVSASGAKIACATKFLLSVGQTASSKTYYVTDSTTSTTIFTITCTTGTSCTVSGSGTVAAGDLLKVLAPSSADSTAAGLVGSMCATY